MLNCQSLYFRLTENISKCSFQAINITKLGNNFDVMRKLHVVVKNNNCYKSAFVIRNFKIMRNDNLLLKSYHMTKSNQCVESGIVDRGNLTVLKQAFCISKIAQIVTKSSKEAFQMHDKIKSFILLEKDYKKIYFTSDTSIDEDASTMIKAHNVIEISEIMTKRHSNSEAVKIKPELKKNNSVIRNLDSGTKRYYSSEASFEVQECKLHKMTSGPPTNATMNKTEGLGMLHQMHVIRKMENAAATMYREKLIRGFLHLYSGQEAVAVGMRRALREQDTVITAYRCHGWTYLMGSSVLGVMAELTGRSSGCAKGKGGSMHMYTPTFYGGNGIVGAQIPLGVGLAFAAKYKNTGGVCVALYGDGASNQGQLYEVFNIAKLWSLPCIFVCENNGYGMGTSTNRASANIEFYTRGDTIPGLWVDGMDVLAVREATKFAIDHCITDKGPILIEMATYRYFGHSVSDPGTSYRSREEVQGVRKTRDAINLLKDRLVSSKIATEDEVKKVEDEAKAEVDQAIEKSKTDPEPPVKELVADIYATWDAPIRGKLPIQQHKHENFSKPKNL